MIDERVCKRCGKLIVLRGDAWVVLDQVRPSFCKNPSTSKGIFAREHKPLSRADGNEGSRTA